MGLTSWSSILRALKPVAAGVALAYLVTALVDGPPPVNFRPENPNSAKQAEIVEPHAELVIEKNVMKLGSLLSVKVDEAAYRKVGGVVVNESEMFFIPESGPGSLPSVKGEVVELPDS
jgi:hypothetical protein